MRVSKRETASEQIDQGICSFFAGFTASAVTLAGAAETSLSDPDDPGGGLFHLMKAAGVRRGLSETEVISRSNEVRDWLKHSKHHLPEPDLHEEHAVIMILRAYTKLTSAFGDGAATPTMRKFEDWFRRNYADWL